MNKRNFCQEIRTYCDENGVVKEYKKAFEVALAAAEEGLLWAMSLLGDFYYYGWGVEKSREKANFWYYEENYCKDMLLQYFKNKKGNPNMYYDVKTKCKNCGKIFTIKKEFLFEISESETPIKEEFEDVAFLHRVRGINAFCPECRKYEIMIKYKRNWVEDFIKLEKEMKGFTKIGKIKEWQEWIDRLPDEKGVYVVTRETESTPEFLVVGTGGFHKGKNPNVDIEKLSKKWYYSSHKIMYVGRAGYDDKNPNAEKCKSTIRNRVRAFMRFGSGKNVGHWGGRYIWQLESSGDLEIWYKVCDEPQKAERELIEKYHPFANLKNGDKE